MIKQVQHLSEKKKILSMMNFGLSSGELYDTDEFNRRLLIADDLPGVSLTGFLQSGKKLVTWIWS